MEHSNYGTDRVEFAGWDLKPDIESFDEFGANFFARVGVEVGVRFENGGFFVRGPGGLGGEMREHRVVPFRVVAERRGGCLGQVRLRWTWSWRRHCGDGSWV